MSDKSLVVAQINFRNNRLAYIITGITLACFVIMDIVLILLDRFGVFSGGEGNATIGLGNYLFLLLLLSAIFVPARNFRKIMNLGGKRADYFTGCAATHIIIAAAVSFAGIVLYYTYDRLVSAVYYGGGSLNVLNAFGWITNGPVVAFLQQFAFLVFVAAFIHTLTAMQDKWYGWVADIVIIAIISVFTPIAPLRAALVWFFNLIIFHRFAFVQIASCLVLAALLYLINKPLIARKTI